MVPGCIYFNGDIHCCKQFPFYLLGASVLHENQNIPEGFQMIEILSTMYTESLGHWAKSYFMLGALVVLYSTCFSALAAWTRIFSDIFGQIGWIKFYDMKQRKRTIMILPGFFFRPYGPYSSSWLNYLF